MAMKEEKKMSTTTGSVTSSKFVVTQDPDVGDSDDDEPTLPSSVSTSTTITNKPKTTGMLDIVKTDLALTKDMKKESKASKISLNVAEEKKPKSQRKLGATVNGGKADTGSGLGLAQGTGGASLASEVKKRDNKKEAKESKRAAAVSRARPKSRKKQQQEEEEEDEGDDEDEGDESDEDGDIVIDIEAQPPISNSSINTPALIQSLSGCIAGALVTVGMSGIFAFWALLAMSSLSLALLMLLVLIVFVLGVMAMFMWGNSHLFKVDKSVLTDDKATTHEEYSKRYTRIVILSAFMIMVQMIALGETLLEIMFNLKRDQSQCPSGIFVSFANLTDNGKSIFCIIFANFVASVVTFVLTINHAYALSGYHLRRACICTLRAEMPTIGQPIAATSDTTDADTDRAGKAT